ncbi:MAG: MHYT domain-containing protein [Methylococcales bacterium]|nr:signal protein [Methylococcaceae bacterium]
MQISYNFALVGVSFAIAVSGSFMALISTRNALRRDSGDRRGLVFLASLCLGAVAIWSMHFIGMLACSLHGAEVDFLSHGALVNYDWVLTVLSFMVGVGVVYIGVSIMCSGKFNFSRLLMSGTFVGLGVAAMHYTGMLAMHVQADVVWNWTIIAASVGIAVVAANVALWLAIHVKRIWHIVVSAIVMGVAVCGMHYTGMAAAEFTYNANLPLVASMSGSSSILVFCIMTIDLGVILIAALIAISESNKQQELEATMK